MQCIAALDYEHLDDGKFLLKLAQSISGHPDFHPLFVHCNSANTERIMQQGVMRDEAEIQNIKTLNHRLVNLFADEGVSALGVHGYQKRAITYEDGKLSIDEDFFEHLPSVSIFVSTLVWNEETESVKRAELPRLVKALMEKVTVEPLFCFNLQEKADEDLVVNSDDLQWNKLSENFTKQYIPKEFRKFDQQLQLISAESFGHEDRKSQSVTIQK